MSVKAWYMIRDSLGQQPITEGLVDGENPIYVEHYFYNSVDRTLAGMPSAALVTQFGGAPVREGGRFHARSQNLPTQSMLIPKGVPTSWHYSGTVDFAGFYFLDGGGPLMRNLFALAQSRDRPIQFSDPLVGTLARQLVNEIRRGSTEEDFKARLAALMLEQTWRVLTTPSVAGLNPRQAHFTRLQAALNYIHANLVENLSVDELARQAELSVAHFRRIFQDAMGLPPHRYVLSVRLEEARKLLSVTAMPLAHIAQQCGFSSQSHLTVCFRAAHGLTPAQFRTQIRTARLA